MSNNIIVPIHVSAMRVAQNSAGKDGVVATATADFTKAAEEGKSVSSQWLDGLVTGEEVLCQGVHLHWALPRIFTRAYADQNNYVFPTIPNRWLILRSFRNLNTSHTYTKEIPENLKSAWLVKSDVLHFDEEHGTSIVQHNLNDPLKLRKIQVGKRYPLEVEQKYAYTPDDGDVKESLKAVGYYGTAFAAYYLNSKGALGLDDDLSDIYGDKDGKIDARDLDQIQCKLSYSIIGWHEEKEDDYFQKTLKPALAKLDPKSDHYEAQLKDLFEKDNRICLSGVVRLWTKGED